MTLTLKQAQRFHLGANWTWVKLTEQIAEKQVRRLINDLNREALGNEYRRRGKKLVECVAIERGAMGNNIHPHITIELPPGWSRSKLERWIRHRWVTKSDGWGLPVGTCVDAHDVKGWIRYSAKEGLSKLKQ